MKTHWKILLWLVAGVIVGGVFQFTLDAAPDSGVKVANSADGPKVKDPGKTALQAGDVLTSLIFKRGQDGQRTVALANAGDYASAVESAQVGDVVWHEITERRVVKLSSTSGLELVDVDDQGGARVKKPGDTELREGEVLTELILNRGEPTQRRLPFTDAAGFDAARAQAGGAASWVQTRGRRLVPANLALDSESQRAKWIWPFAFCADIFLRLLKMLIVPIILTSIVTGVVGVGTGRDLKRMGLKTFAYYITTSMLAIFLGLTLVNLIKPGDGAELGLAYDDRFSTVQETEFHEVILRMVPENVFDAFSANLNMLQVIFFALLFGFFILQVKEPHRGTMKGFFEAAFEVMMGLARFVLGLIPYGVFCLLVKVVGQTGFEVFKPLGLYMLTVTLALVIHSSLTLPVLLRIVGGLNPIRWVKAVSPALITAFSTSSSSMTLPVSMETVEERGKVSNRVVSFVQPLGATINMDGTALYECIGVIFLAQYYASIGDYDLTLNKQIVVVMMALLASIGAAGIPSAGLIMMVTILAALDLPIEGAALLLAVDRPLDMMRTVTNVFSDTCGAAIIARTEGETGPLDAGA